jgi:hypothetical protein
MTKFESRLHNNTKKLFPKDLLQKINPSPPEKRFRVGTLERELFPQNHRSPDSPNGLKPNFRGSGFASIRSYP